MGRFQYTTMPTISCLLLGVSVSLCLTTVNISLFFFLLLSSSQPSPETVIYTSIHEQMATGKVASPTVICLKFMLL